MLYDASWARNLAPEWFDPRFWAASGAIRGEARGRGTALFVDADGRQFVLRH
ncbi:MAG: hypothetical protein U1F11_05695 [Steroidobacteraceae bacterium]